VRTRGALRRRSARQTRTTLAPHLLMADSHRIRVSRSAAGLDSRAEGSSRRSRDERLSHAHCVDSSDQKRRTHLRRV
jgi:hypothetical protein